MKLENMSQNQKTGNNINNYDDVDGTDAEKALFELIATDEGNLKITLPDKKEIEGCSLLQNAIATNDKPLFDQLVSIVDLRFTNKAGQTALDVAVVFARHEMVNRLMQQSASENIVVSDATLLSIGTLGDKVDESAKKILVGQKVKSLNSMLAASVRKEAPVPAPVSAQLPPVSAPVVQAQAKPVAVVENKTNNAFDKYLEEVVTDYKNTISKLNATIATQEKTAAEKQKEMEQLRFNFNGAQKIIDGMREKHSKEVADMTTKHIEELKKSTIKCESLLKEQESQQKILLEESVNKAKLETEAQVKNSMFVDLQNSMRKFTAAK